MIFKSHLFAVLIVAFFAPDLKAENRIAGVFTNLDASEHDYWNRPLNDPFTKIISDLESGRIQLDHGNEKSFLLSLLEALDIPVNSQTLVFSTTSLQLSLISPRTPRAIYFNEEIYLGYVPGGKIEIISIDPELGGIFYIFDIPKDHSPPVVRRSKRCMNCHSAEDTRDVPGIVIKSVIPGPRGGSLESYRRRQTGHQIPYHERFGGWYLTGAESLSEHWGNVTGQFTPDGIKTSPLEPGKTFTWSRFPVETSDLLAHLIHEHQAGFVNRVFEAHYLARTCEETGNAALRASLDQTADSLVRYLLFADEPEFPQAGIEGTAAYRSEFLSNRIADSSGKSLKDLNLKERLFNYRCSYMIYSPAFTNLPATIKQPVLEKINAALSDRSNPDYTYLSGNEKAAILDILKSTHPDWKTN